MPFMSEFYPTFPSPFPEEPKPRQPSAAPSTGLPLVEHDFLSDAKSALDSVVQMEEPEVSEPGAEPEAGPARLVSHEMVSNARRSLVSIVAISIAVIVMAGFITQHVMLREPKPIPESNSSTGSPNFIIATRGGEAIGDGARVIIPPYALREDTLIEIERIPTGGVTDLYHIKPDGLKFLRPVTLIIPYDEGELAAGESADEIQLEWWSPKTAHKSKLPFTVDIKNVTLHAELGAL